MRRFLWSAFVVLDTLLLIVFAAGFVARWIDPRLFWWPQLGAILLPLTSILLVFFCVVPLVRKKRVLFSLHVVLILFAVSRFFSANHLPAPSLVDDHSLRVTSYNLGQLESLTQPELADKLSEVLRFVRPDVVCLQEFLVRYRGDPLRFRNLPSVADMFESLDYQAVASQDHQLAHAFKPVFVQRNKLDIISKERIILAGEASNDFNVIRTVVNWQGREAAIYNIHLRTFGERKPWSESALNPLNPSFWSVFLSQYKDAFIERAWEADQVYAQIQNETLPFMIVGDFNSTTHNWAFNRIAKELKDVFEEAGLKRKMSYHSRFPVVRIDHVLVSEEWEVLGADILPFTHSDHLPLLAVLKWKE